MAEARPFWIEGDSLHTAARLIARRCSPSYWNQNFVSFVTFCSGLLLSAIPKMLMRFAAR